MDLNNTDLFQYMETQNCSEIHIKSDPATGLNAIIAIHNTQNGPALGGCRCLEYTDFQAAMTDAIRLAQGMTYKAALAKLPLGGGKTVLLKPAIIPDRQAYFEALGCFINELSGRYITAVDSGTSPDDMDIIATQTNYVTCNKQANGLLANPSPYTAKGVCRGIEAAVKFKLKANSLENIRVFIQGVGQVGYYLAKELNQRGAKLYIHDINTKALERCADEFQAIPVTLNEAYLLDFDVYAPCALGGILHPESINLISAPIIAGAANNQLILSEHGRLLHEKGILYAPDYVINAGGLIHCYAQYTQLSESCIHQKIDEIYNTLWNIFECSHHENKPTNFVADKMALSTLKQ